MLLHSCWATSAAMSLPFFFPKFSHNFKILFLNISHNFKILLKRNDFQPYLHHKAQFYINVVNLVFNANPSVSPSSPFALLVFHTFKTSEFHLSNAKLSLFPPWSLHLLWITSSYLFNCHFAKKITSSYLFIS